MAITPTLRRLRRGAVSVELDPATSEVLMRCATDGAVERVSFDSDGLGALLVAFFRTHQACSAGAWFEIDDDA